MAARNDSGGNDRDGADAVVLELLVLDRLLYRNRSQHRSAKYFALVVEVRRACKTFAAPKLPDLLAQGLGLIASVPDSRNSRTREAWVRSAAAGLSRMRVAAIACAYSLESIVKASKHLAHQVSQTYFMALSTVLMACLARLFACNLHLGGRLLQVHAALLRTLLAQPCTSECLSASDMAECRVPEDTASFLSRLRGAGGAHRAARTKTTRDSTSTAAAAIASGSRGSKDTAEPPAPLPTTPKPSSQAQGGEGGTGVDDDDADKDEDEDDTGEHIGRAPTAAEAAAGEEAEMDWAVAHPVEINALHRTTRLGRAGATAAAAESQGGSGGGVGQVRTTARGSAGADGRASGARRPGGGSGDSRGGAGKKGVGQARKKVVLASEFSDSSSEEESDTEYTAATAVSSTSDSAHKRGREGPTPPQPPADKLPVSADQAAAAAVSDTSPERPAVRRHQPSLFFSSAPRGPQQLRSKPNGRRTSDPVAAVASSASPASRSSGTSGGNDIAASASWPTVTRETPEHACVVAAPVPGPSGRVGWTIDPTPTPTPRPTPEPAVDAPPSSGRKREGKKSGRRRGGGDRPAGAAPAVAVVEDLEVNARNDGFREGVTPSASGTPELNTDTGGGTSVAVDAGEAGAPATSGGGGRTATGTTGVSAPPSAETLHRKSRGKLEGTKARRRLSSDPKILGPESLGGVGEQEQESSRAGGGAAGAEPPRRDGVPITAGGKPHAPGKSVKSEGGAGAGTKRGSSGRKLEEKFRKAKKQKTKKKKNAGGGPSPSTPGGTGKRGGGSGGRNAIDDIFGSLL